MPIPSTMFRGLAVVALAATLAVPMGAWADNGNSRGRGGDGDEVERNRHAQDDRGLDDAAAAAPAVIPATTSATTSAGSSTAVSPTAAQASVLSLSVVEGATPRDWGFAPPQVTTTVGTTLTWTNTGAQDHTVTSDDGTSFDSSGLAPNGTFSFTPTAAGTYGYHCAIHPFMKATLTVTR